MAICTVTAQGQTTIPVEVRRHLGIRTGDRLELIVLDDGEVVLRRADRAVKELFGLLAKKATGKVSLEEMNQAIESEAKKSVQTSKGGQKKDDRD